MKQIRSVITVVAMSVGTFIVTPSTTAHDAPSGHWGGVVMEKSGNVCWVIDQHDRQTVVNQLAKQCPYGVYPEQRYRPFQGWVSVYSTNTVYIGLGRAKTRIEAEQAAYDQCLISQRDDMGHANDSCYRRLVLNTSSAFGFKQYSNWKGHRIHGDCQPPTRDINGNIIYYDENC